MDWVRFAFSDVDDPRAKNARHPLVNVLFISFAAAVSGMLSLREIELFANEKKGWLSQFINLESGVPTMKTFHRLLLKIDPQQLLRCYLRLIQPLVDTVEGHVAVDGKTLRGSSVGGNDALHLVNAWASDLGLILGQVKTDSKSNEITAIPELLRIVGCKGRTISIDAMGCQREICEQIVGAKGNYLIALKGNQPKLFQAIKAMFETFTPEDHPEAFSTHTTHDKGHGREEVRAYAFTEELGWLDSSLKWPGLCSIGKTTATVVEGDKERVETRYFVSSLKADGKLQGRIVRDHWTVENNLHWSLDVVFDEDRHPARLEKSPENFSALRKCALSLLGRHKTKKIGIKGLMRKCALNDDFRAEVLLPRGYDI